MGIMEEEEVEDDAKKPKEKHKYGWSSKPKKEDLDLEAQELEASTGYIIIKHLGAGSFGTVKLCQQKSAGKKRGHKKGDDGEKFAMKIFKKDVLKKQRQMKMTNGKRTFVSALDKVYTGNFPRLSSASSSSDVCQKLQS
jgi:serine/threonine protein kinase